MYGFPARIVRLGHWAGQHLTPMEVVEAPTSPSHPHLERGRVAGRAQLAAGLAFLLLSLKMVDPANRCSLEAG